MKNRFRPRQIRLRRTDLVFYSVKIQSQPLTEDMLSDSNTDSMRRIVTSRENAIRQILNWKVRIRWNLNKALHFLTLAEKYINSTSESLFTWRRNVTFFMSYATPSKI